MSKADKKRLDLMRLIENENVVKYNQYMGRDIGYEEYDKKLLNNRDYFRHKKTKDVVLLELNEKLCEVPSDYLLSNFPVLCEKRSMQEYYFKYNSLQLKNMYQTPKIIVDKFYNSFSTSSGIVYRTSFYAVAPHAQRDIPSLYRLSITTCSNNPEHYNISLHAIVGGKEDGWLFLGRFDNDTTEAHLIVETEYSRKELKKCNAILSERNTFIQNRLRSKYALKQNNQATKLYSVPFPHMHKPTTLCDVEEDVERNLPKFMRNCVYNNFEQNVSYMLKVFNIYDHLHLRTKDELVCNIMKAEKKITTLNKNPSASEILKELPKNITIEHKADVKGGKMTGRKHDKKDKPQIYHKNTEYKRKMWCFVWQIHRNVLLILWGGIGYEIYWCN